MYNKTPLKEVIFRVDFDRTSLGNLKTFSDEALKFFSNESYKPVKSEIVNITNNQGKHDTKVESITNHEYTFKHESLNNNIKVTNECFIIQYLDYSNHDDFFTHLELLNHFVNIFDIKVINRLGLRYVNLIENFKEDDEFLNRKFYGIFDFFSDEKEKIARNMGKVIKKEDNSNLEINYGVWNNNFPSPINKWDFILDIDCHNKTPISVQDEDIIQITKNFHGIIITNFEKIITQKYRDFLNT